MALRTGLLLGLLLALAAPASSSEFAGLDAASEPLSTLVQTARKLRTGRLAAAESAAPGESPISYAAVCRGDGDALAAEREGRLKAGLQAIEPALRIRFAVIASKHGLPVMEGKDYLASTLTSITYTYPHSSAKAKAALADFAEAIEEAVLARVRAPDYARIKAALIARIESKTTLSSEDKAKLVHRVQVTEMALPSRYIREYLTTTDELWPVVPQLFADQAWNASYDDLGGAAVPELTPDMSLIILYPGFLLAEDRGDGSSHLDYVLAHETAHSIDSGRFPGLYKDFIGCMKTAHGADFKAWDEVLADYWAAEALSGLPNAGAAELGKSFEIVCGTSGEGADSLLGHLVSAEHPSGRYRIDRILGGNAELLRSLGVSAPPASCGL
ncbi:MAG: hypothetical protein WC969_04695 [Elusimicrobiota bacterium]|jgi:hypothetical protein